MLGILEALPLELVVLYEFVRPTVVRIPFVEDILANFVKGLADVRVVAEELLNDLSVDLRILVVQLIFLNELQIIRKTLCVPDVFLNLLQGDPFDRIWLQHPVYEILNCWR